MGGIFSGLALITLSIQRQSVCGDGLPSCQLDPGGSDQRAGDLCDFKVGHNPVPTSLNPLGAKGAGEAGTVGALAAAMNAIVDAIGTENIEMPTTPERVWQALQKIKT